MNNNMDIDKRKEIETHESVCINFIEKIICRKLFEFEKQMLINMKNLTSDGKKLYISMGPKRQININIC